MSKTCEITGLTESQQDKWPLTYSLLTSDSKQNSSEISSSNCEQLSKDVLDFVSNQEISKNLTEVTKLGSEFSFFEKKKFLLSSGFIFQQILSSF